MVYGDELGNGIPETLEEANPDTVEIESLGICNVLKVHDDGDLTVLCGGKRYMVTPEGDIFEETGLSAPEMALEVEENPIMGG